MAEKGVRTAKTVLLDHSPAGRRKKASLGLTVRMADTFVEVVPDGATAGEGATVMLEFYNGKLRVVVFGDDAEPLQNIELELPTGDKPPA